MLLFKISYRNKGSIGLLCVGPSFAHSFFLSGYLDPLAFHVEANPRKKTHINVGDPNQRETSD
jgi:hypothetical protein